MKTLKQILELYKPKSQDEDKFVKKHIVVKHRDRNGNGDPVFQATNIKSVDRKAERHGYEPGQDEEVYEETEDHVAGKAAADEAMERHDKAMQAIEKAKGTKQAPKDPQFQEHMKKYNEAMDKYNYHHNALRNMGEETELDETLMRNGKPIAPAKGGRIAGALRNIKARQLRNTRANPDETRSGLHGEIKMPIPAGQNKGLRSVNKSGPKKPITFGEETEHLEEKYYHTPGHLKKELEDKYGPSHTTMVDADENSGTIKHIIRHLDDDEDGEESYETRVHELIGSGPIKNRTIGKLIRHVGKRRSLRREETEHLEEAAVARHITAADKRTALNMVGEQPSPHGDKKPHREQGGHSFGHMENALEPGESADPNFDPKTYGKPGGYTPPPRGRHFVITVTGGRGKAQGKETHYLVHKSGGEISIHRIKNPSPTPDEVSKVRAASKKKLGEETEHLEEKLKVSDGIGAWISDFIHSKNPKFDGFSKRKRMKMAQAAFYSAQRGE